MYVPTHWLDADEIQVTVRAADVNRMVSMGADFGVHEWDE